VAWQFSTDDSPAKAINEDSGPVLPSRHTTLFESLPGQTVFVGRDQERTVLRLLLAKVVRGGRQVVMIGGAHGVGKTRLANELRTEASRNGFVTLGGSCFERGIGAPLDPFVQMLEAAVALTPNHDFLRVALGDEVMPIVSLLPQLHRTFANLVSPEDDAPRPARPLSLDAFALNDRVLFDAIIKVLARLTGNKPLLLFIDDLHWADDGTLGLLAHVARAKLTAPLMIIGTFRDIEWKPAGPLRDFRMSW
jgi:predicted ATPase